VFEALSLTLRENAKRILMNPVTGRLIFDESSDGKAHFDESAMVFGRE
jgi:hypothetical protein